MKELRELRFLLREDNVVTQPKISPDGRWMAYLSGKFGQLEVFVSPFPDVNSGKWKISRDGGYLPLWSPDGKELYYRNGNKVIAVPVETETTFYPGEPEVIFEGTYIPYNQKPVDVATWDIHPSDKRFLMIKPLATNDSEPKIDDSPKINIVLNWFEELKQRVPVD